MTLVKYWRCDGCKEIKALEFFTWVRFSLTDIDDNKFPTYHFCDKECLVKFVSQPYEKWELSATDFEKEHLTQFHKTRGDFQKHVKGEK